MRFAQRHDAFAGNSEWHIFDSNPNYLKVYCQGNDGRKDYRLFLYPQQVERDWLTLKNPDHDVWLRWDPENLAFTSSELHDKLKAGHVWDAEYAYKWLVASLLPRVLGKTVSTSVFEPCFSEWSVRRELANKEIANQEDLARLLHDMQSFFATYSLTYVPVAVMKGIYDATKLALLHYEVSKGDSCYVRSKLGCDQPIELNSVIDSKVSQISLDPTISGADAEYALRPLCVIVDRGRPKNDILHELKRTLQPVLDYYCFQLELKRVQSIYLAKARKVAASF